MTLRSLIFALRLIPACKGSFSPSFNSRYWFFNVISAGNLYPRPWLGSGGSASEPMLVTVPSIAPKSAAGKESMLISASLPV